MESWLGLLQLLFLPVPSLEGVCCMLNCGSPAQQGAEAEALAQGGRSSRLFVCPHT